MTVGTAGSDPADQRDARACCDVVAERQSLLKALAFGVACGLIGVIGVGCYMEAVIPVTELDQFIIRLLR